jgi:hypothetical protein
MTIPTNEFAAFAIGGILDPTLMVYARKYPDVPPEVILKEDVLRLGVYFSEDALDFVKGCRTQAYFLFSYNISSHDELGVRASSSAPEDIRLSGGPFALRPISVRVVLAKGSPYLVDVVDGRLTLCENGVPVADVEAPRRPSYYGRTLDDGTRFEQVIPLLYNHYGFITTFRACHYWGHKEECMFCDINNHLRELRRQTGDHVSADAVKDVGKVVEVIGAMAAEPDPAFRLITILMTGGSIVRKLRGADNAAEFNIPYVEAIRARIGNRIPIVMITESQPMPAVRALRQAGVTSHNANLEVWDRKLFQVLAPGKEKYVGYDRWLQNLYDAVEIMGEGNVSPNMVSGLEMVRPWGFATVREAVTSAREGFETLMSHGVVPHLDTWCVEPGSGLDGHPPVPLDFLILADVAWYETWRKYSLPPFTGYGPMGAPGCAVYGNTASVDVGS